MSSQLLEILSFVFDKKGRDYINISELKKGKIATLLSNILGVKINKNHSNGELMNLIKPSLSSDYYFKKRGRSIYLLNKIPPLIIYTYAKNHESQTLNSIYSHLPFPREEFADALNTLIKEEKIDISIISQSNQFGCKIIPKINKQPISEIEELKKTYLELLRGKSYVKVFEIRRRLNWQNEKFNNTIQKLWDDGIIELQGSNRSLLSREEIADSYLDKNNQLMILLVWRK